MENLHSLLGKTSGKFSKSTLTLSAGNSRPHLPFQLFANFKVQHEIARFSEVNYRSTPDYTFDFADCQTMELIQGKIRRCISLMEAHAETISALIAYYRKIQQSIPNETDDLPPAYTDDAAASLNECHNLNARHTRDLRQLLHSAESTRLLVCLPPSFPQ